MLRPGVVVQLLFVLSAVFAGILSDVAFLPSAFAEEKAAQPVDLAGESAQMAGYLPQVAGYLLILIVLATLAVHLGRRFRPGLGGGRGPIHIVDGHNLAPGVGVRLIRIGSQGWLIGVTKERISLLASVAMEDLSAEDLALSSTPVGMRQTKPAAWTGVGDNEPKV